MIRRGRQCSQISEGLILRLNAAIADTDAEGHGELLDLGEAGRGHHLHHLVAADEGIYRFWEIFVRAGFVAGDEGRRAREDFSEIEVVEGAQNPVRGEREFENDQSAAWAKD